MIKDEHDLDRRMVMLHERQTPDPDAEDAGVTAKRALQSAQRAAQGERTDWKLHLQLTHGTRLVPDGRLTVKAKTARTRSIKLAADRRTKRRNSTGITLHFDVFAWKRIGAERREAFEVDRHSIAHRTGRRWDHGHDFHWYNLERDGGQHLDHLFRSGTPQARPEQPFREHLRETSHLLEGWFTESVQRASP